MAIQNSAALRGYFLAAMPTLQDDLFQRSVIYVCEHQSEGAVGIIVNQPMPYDLNFMFEQLHILPQSKLMNKTPLLFGGPMQPERGFVIHQPNGQHWRSSMVLSDEVVLTTSNDIIRDIADGYGPNPVVVALGFVGWGPLQLDKEIEDKWLVCPYDSAILYELPFEDRWHAAAKGLGIDDVDHLILTGPGHA